MRRAVWLLRSRRRTVLLCNSFAILADTLKCKLTCEDAETHEVIKVKEDVIDGTLCSYDVPNDICVRGRCRVSNKVC